MCGFTNTCFQCIKYWMKGSEHYAHLHQFHSNLSPKSCWTNPRGWYMYKRGTFFYISGYRDKLLYKHQRRQCSPRTEAQSKRQPSPLGLVHLWRMSPYRWAGLVHAAADHTILSANTALVAYINSSSHPCFPTVQALLAALLQPLVQAESAVQWTPLEAEGVLMGRCTVAVERGGRGGVSGSEWRVQSGTDV